jgi:hypothetical protein
MPVRIAGAALLLLALLAPEVEDYRAEHRLRTLTTAFRTLVRPPPGASRDAALLAVEAGALAVASVQTGDHRALLLAGSARLLARDAGAALAHYRAALRRGERAEIDLNLARAHLLRRDLEPAQAALLRSAWISPALAHGLPADARRSLLREVKLLSRALRAGRLTEPPALSPVDRPPGAG